MDNRKTIQTALDYIEENLKAEISVSDLSDMTGYSLYHFYRLFQSATGMPVMQYILRRKLLNAIYDISSGLSKTEAALLYGFETYAGFYKAFKREIGYTPSDFLKRFKVKKPYKINLFKEEHIMLTHKKIAEILKHWGLQSESIKDIYYEET
ncbi:MAG: helix-turn-helix transcriptional regulator, partial [Ruminococcus sp.]|nr:helix-turn-helix transcriptional regulator [Ruminococcus sp.]